MLDLKFKTIDRSRSVPLCQFGKTTFSTRRVNDFCLSRFFFVQRLTFNVDRSKESIVTLYDNALAACHQIRQLHPFLLPKLKFPADLFLSSVGLLEDEVCKVRDRLTIAYKRSTIPLRAYAKEYSRYQSFFNLDIPQYIE